MTQNIIRLVGLLFLGIIALSVLVYSSLTRVDAKKNFLPIFIRTLLNHLQLLVLTAKFELEWPSQIKQFFQIFGSVSEVSTQFISFDCLIYDSQDDPSFGLIQEGLNFRRPWIIKMLIISLLPLIVIITSYLAWSLIYGFSALKQSFNQRGKILSNSDATANITPISSLKLNDEPTPLDSSYSNLINKSKWKS